MYNIIAHTSQQFLFFRLNLIHPSSVRVFVGPLDSDDNGRRGNEVVVRGYVGGFVVRVGLGRCDGDCARMA